MEKNATATKSAEKTPEKSAEKTATKKAPAKKADKPTAVKAAAGRKATPDKLTIEPEKLIVIGLDTIDGEAHPLYDERIGYPLSEETLDNYADIGIRDALHVKRVKMADVKSKLTDEASQRLKKFKVLNEDYAIIVIQGRQRTRGARELNKRFMETGETPIKVKIEFDKGSNLDKLGRMSLALDQHRVQDPAFIQALKAGRLYDRNGGDIEEVATTMKWGVTHAKRVLTFLERATDDVKEAVKSNKIGFIAGVCLAEKLPADTQDVTIQELLDKVSKHNDAAEFEKNPIEAKRHLDAAKRLCQTGFLQGLARQRKRELDEQVDMSPIKDPMDVEDEDEEEVDTGASVAGKKAKQKKAKQKKAKQKDKDESQTPKRGLLRATLSQLATDLDKALEAQDVEKELDIKFGIKMLNWVCDGGHPPAVVNAAKRRVLKAKAAKGASK